MCIQSQFKNGLIVGIFGAAFTTFIALLGWVGVPEIIEDVTRKVTVIEEDNFVWELWSEPPFYIYTDYYIFNCTNYQDVVENGAKPVVNELGPYSYRQYRKKNTSVVQNTDEIVYYREHRVYYYSKSTSGPATDQKDLITTINPVYMTLSTFLNRLPIDNQGINFIVNYVDNFLAEKNESVFMTITAEELIFKGWPLDTYIELYEGIKDLLDNWPIFLPDLPPNLPPLPNLPPSISDGVSVGLFTLKNDTDDGLFKVNRGTKNYELFGKIEAWGDDFESLSSYLNYWKGEDSYCNKIMGTDGTIFPTSLNVDEKLFLYQTDLCRSVYLVYNGTYTYDGLPAKQFILPKSALENRTNEPENECFCLDENDEGRCPNTGAMFIGACYEGAPIIGSNPHFFNADPRYINGVEGLRPEAAKHQTVLLMEERTNTLLYAAKRVQLSFDVKRSRLSATQNLPSARVFLPMLWYEESARIDEETSEEFDIFTTIEIVLWVLFACGLVLTIVGAALVLNYRYKEKRSHKVV